MLKLLISVDVAIKLREKHQVTRQEVEQAFHNSTMTYRTDTREAHRTDPPTLFFFSPTDAGRWLKVCFVFRDGVFHLKTAFPVKPPDWA